MAVIDKIANVRSAKVHPERNAWIRMVGISVPKRHLDRIENLSVDALVGLSAVDLEIVLRLHQEMDLMDVELMVLQGLILDRPVLNRTLRRSDCRRIVRIEENRRRARFGDVEL